MKSTAAWFSQVTISALRKFPDLKTEQLYSTVFQSTYAMTGWRAGFGVMSKELAPMISRLMTNSNSCTNAFVQKACIEALEGPQDSVEQMKAEFLARRDIIVDGLNSIPGFSCIVPDGAFYAFPNITKTGYNSRDLNDHLLIQR